MSMSTAWKGNLGFALVNVPVKLYLAVGDTSKPQFHQYHGTCTAKTGPGRIRYPKKCEACNEQIDGTAGIERGVDRPGGGKPVLITKADMETLPLTTAKLIDVEQFTPAAGLDYLTFAKSYYVDPQDGGARAYCLIRDAMRKQKTAGICKITLGTREQLAALWVHGDYMVLSVMAWPADVREPVLNFLNDQPKTRPNELAMAVQLVESMTGEFDPAAHTDEYDAALRKLVEAKAEGTPVEPVAETAAASDGDDLENVLAMSLGAKKKPAGAKPRAKRTAA